VFSDGFEQAYASNEQAITPLSKKPFVTFEFIVLYQIR